MEKSKKTKTKKEEKEVKKQKAAKKPEEKEKQKKKPIKKKVKTEAKPKPKEAEEKILESEKYFEAVGRRKTAAARVRLFTRGEKAILVNENPYEKYFSTLNLQQIVSAPLRKMKCLDKFRVLVKIKGGGIHAQAEATRHGIARALVKFNPNFRKRLRRAGYLTRDPRQRERKKFGLKRARRAPQWQKR